MDSLISSQQPCYQDIFTGEAENKKKRSVVTFGSRLKAPRQHVTITIKDSEHFIWLTSNIEDKCFRFIHRVNENRLVFEHNENISASDGTTEETKNCFLKLSADIFHLFHEKFKTSVKGEVCKISPSF